MASWIPWTLLVAFLPSNATEVLKDDGKRQRMRHKLTQMASEYSKLLLLWVFQVVQVFAGISFLVVIASMLYALLYYLVIPSRFHKQDIYFNYGPRHGAITHPPYGHFMPTASLDLQDPVHQWQSRMPASKQATSPVLVPGVKYDIIVEITVPESRVNADVGVCMVFTSLWEAGNEKPVASSARPTTMHDMPVPVRWIRIGFWLVPYALGFTEPVETLRVTAINGYLENTKYPLTRVHIELNTHKLQVYTAKLTVIAQLTGIRYLMYHWAVPTAILFILNIVFVEVLALVILYAVYILPRLEEEVGANTIVLEAAATNARDKAKRMFETGSSANAETGVHMKSEALTSDKSLADFDEVMKKNNDEVMDVKKEGVDEFT